MANYPQELAQDAVCQSHTGLWFLPARPLSLNTNEGMNDLEFTFFPEFERWSFASFQMTIKIILCIFDFLHFWIEDKKKIYGIKRYSNYVCCSSLIQCPFYVSVI